MSAFSMTRLDELQADDAIWGLDENARLELVDALCEAKLEPDSSWEHSAAVATIALQQAIPSGPSERLLRALRDAAPLSRPMSERSSGPSLASSSASSPLVEGVAKWWAQPNAILAAALLTLSAVLWWTNVPSQSVVAPQALRQELLQVRDAAVWSWSGGAPEGDVVWHGPSQRGAMRFRGLPVNDPSQHQYQLWIVDAKRNAAHPVDGGVFNVPNGQAEVVIPIDPKVVVHEAQAFVVTVEAPGGVVVSDREQIVVLAKPL